MAQQGLTRRTFLIGGASVGAAAALGVAVSGNPFGATDHTIQYWHLFGGGDGARMTAMLGELHKRQPNLDIRSLILPWGNPYYTKLSIAAVGGSPPDVAISHATRLVEFAPAGLLEPLDPAQLERHGIGPDKFIDKAWKLGTFNGKQYAIPLDTHPFVLYSNTKLAKQAGLLDSKGVLRDMSGQGALLDAFEAVKKKTDATGLVMETRGVTPWRLFLTLYTQLGGRPVVSADGTELTMEDDKALRALEWMAEPHKRGAGGQDVDYQASVALFGNQTAGFLLNGEWEVTTYQAQKLPFDMRPVPVIFDHPANQADSHTFVIPRRANRSPEQLDSALAFIAGLVKQSLTWSEGGHVPAYKPVLNSPAFAKLKPQSHYAATAADRVVVDPQAWFSGSGSNLEAEAGTAFQPVVTGAATPQQGLASFRSALETLVKVPPPVGKGV
jgi:multiple sugar transport system substrate-binding protein